MAGFLDNPGELIEKVSKGGFLGLSTLMLLGLIYLHSQGRKTPAPMYWICGLMLLLAAVPYMFPPKPPIVCEPPTVSVSMDPSSLNQLALSLELDLDLPAPALSCASQPQCQPGHAPSEDCPQMNTAFPLKKSSESIRISMTKTVEELQKAIQELKKKQQTALAVATAGGIDG